MSSARPTYGFGGRLSATFPSQIIVDVSEVCNLACTHCPHPAFKASAHYTGASMDPALNRKVVSEVANHPGIVQQIRYAAQGEPLVHKDLFEMLAHAVAHTDAYVSLTTNGTLLDDRRVDALLATGVHMVDVSLDAIHDDTYARIRVGGRLEKTRANVHRLLDRVRASESATRVVVSYVEQPENQAETSDFEAYWRGRGVADVVVRRLHSASGGVIPVADVLRKAVAQADRYPCVYPWERVVVTPCGHLSFCPQNWSHASIVADYTQTTIAEVWRGLFYDRLRAAHAGNRFDGFELCGSCPDWAQTRWPNQGTSYADLVARLKESAA